MHFTCQLLARLLFYLLETGCSCLNENVPYRLRILYSQLMELFGRDLGGVALLEGICQWGQTSSIYSFCNDFSYIRLILLGSRGHAGTDKPSGRSD